jgi:hypothetical protein
MVGRVIRVLELAANKDLRWDFASSEPTFYVNDGNYGRHVKVDPFPAYGHELAAVNVECARVWNTFPLDRDIAVYILDREEVGRCSGQTFTGANYSGEKKDDEYPWTATIVLSGKRIPIHPAMTRYLVAHEYGHVVSRYLRWLRKEGDKSDSDSPMYQEYAKLRGCPPGYGGGKWHSSVMELFANDFRILVVGSEKEFWPHPGFARPEGLPEVVEWWKKAEELKFKETLVLAT